MEVAQVGVKSYVGGFWDSVPTEYSVNLDVLLVSLEIVQYADNSLVLGRRQ